MQDYTNDAVKAVMSAYTPVEVKRLLHSHDESMFVHHQDPKDIVEFYGTHNEDIHHWLLDDSHAFEFYANAMGAYNYAQAKCKCQHERDALQQEYLKDVVFSFSDCEGEVLCRGRGGVSVSGQNVSRLRKPGWEKERG